MNEDPIPTLLPNHEPGFVFARDSAYLQVLLLRLTEAKNPRQPQQYNEDWRLDEFRFATENPEVASRLDDAIGAVAQTIRALQGLLDADMRAWAEEFKDDFAEEDYRCGIDELDNWTPQSNSPPKTFIMSVRPRWARAFFAALNPKTIELRKHNFGAGLHSGETILIYSTAPEAAVIGTVTVRSRERHKISTLLKATWQGALACVTEREFNQYYGDAEVGVGVWVENPRPWARSIPLAELRNLWGSWQPPQQIQQLTDEQISALASYFTNQPQE